MAETARSMFAGRPAALSLAMYCLMALAISGGDPLGGGAVGEMAGASTAEATALSGGLGQILSMSSIRSLTLITVPPSVTTMRLTTDTSRISAAAISHPLCRTGPSADLTTRSPLTAMAPSRQARSNCHV